jgi:hypothetical protein
MIVVHGKTKNIKGRKVGQLRKKGVGCNASVYRASS